MSERQIARLQRLDADIVTLQAKLTAKLNDRKALLEALIQDGEDRKTDLTQAISLAQATSFIATGRILTDAQVRDIRKSYKNGESQGSLARRYGVAQPSIHKIVHRQSYRDVS